MCPSLTFRLTQVSSFRLNRVRTLAARVADETTRLRAEVFTFRELGPERKARGNRCDRNATGNLPLLTRYATLLFGIHRT